MATFDVDIEGKTYEVDAPDANTAWKWANATHRQKPAKRDIAAEIANDPISRGAREAIEQDTGILPQWLAGKPQASVPERIAAAPMTRFAVGAASPIMGAAQFVNNAARGIANPIIGALGGQPIAGGDDIRNNLAQYEQMKKAGGATGFDAAGMAGSVLSPAALKAMQIAPAATGMGRMAQGAGIGAAFGAATPVTEGDFASEKAGQIGTGAALGAAIPVASDLIGKGAGVVRNIVDPWLPGGVERTAGRTANKAAGEKRAEIMNLLRRNEQIVPESMPTAGEAAAPAGSTEFAALQQAVKGRLPTDYDAIQQAQNQARVNAIRGVGQDKAALDAAIRERGANAAENYGAVAANRINPRSDQQIMADAIAAKEASRIAALQDKGRFQTMAAQQENLASGGVVTPTAGGSGQPSVGAFPAVGNPRTPARYTPNAARAEEAASAATDTAAIVGLRGKEREFLENATEALQNTVGLDNRSLYDLISRPSMKAAINDARMSAAESGSYFPKGKEDQFSVANLQRIKESLDAGILAAKKSVEAGKRPELSPAELENTKQAFVQWLSNKSPGWRDARLAYAAESAPINQMQVGQFLEGKLTAPMAEQGAGVPQRAAMYAQALREAPQTLKRSTGNPRFNELGEVLTPGQLQTVENVGRDLGRSAEQERLAKLGSERARMLMGEMQPHVPPSGMLNQAYSVFRAISNRIAGRVEGKSLEALSRAMQNPQEMARIMEAATPSERAVLKKAFEGATRAAVIVTPQVGAFTE